MSETIDQEAAMQTATTLWKKHGNGMPLAQWVNNEVVKSKTNGTWKKGADFQTIFEANLAKEKASDISKVAATETQGFKIAGMNGYMVLGGAAIVVVGLIYFGSKLLKSKQNAN